MPCCGKKSQVRKVDPAKVVRQAPREIIKSIEPKTEPPPDGEASEARLPSDGRLCKTCLTVLSRKMRFDKKLQRYQRYYWCSTCAKESY